MLKRTTFALPRILISHSPSVSGRVVPWMSVRRPRRRQAPVSGILPNISTFRIAAAQVQKLDPVEISAMMNGLRSCLSILRSADGHLTHVLEFQMATMSAALIERQGVVRGLSESISAAEESIAAMQLRVEPGSGRVGALFGPEIASLDEFIRLHQYQLEQLSKGEYERILRSLAGRLGGKIQLAISDIDKSGI